MTIFYILHQLEVSGLKWRMVESPSSHQFLPSKFNMALVEDVLHAMNCGVLCKIMPCLYIAVLSFLYSVFICVFNYTHRSCLRHTVEF